MYTISFMPEMYPPPWIHSTPVAGAESSSGDSTSAGTRRAPEGMYIFCTRIPGQGFIISIGRS